jgi:hypothetical protein
MVAGDLEFAHRHPSARLFPETWLWQGNEAYYMRLDPEAAAQSYREALRRQPVMIDAWIALAKAELTAGRAGEAEHILDGLAPLIAHVSTWKWQELLLAYDLGHTQHFAASYNFILSRLPHRISEACYVALQFWGSWPMILPHVAAENRTVFLQQLMAAKEVDVALTLWKDMAADPEAPESEVQLGFCQFLLDNKRLPAAKDVWKGWRGDGIRTIHDGSFELKPLNRAFGWRMGRLPQVVMERTSQFPFEKNYCIHVHFNGKQNVLLNHLSQIVPVEPGRNYVLKFARRSRNITTDQGIFLEAVGYGCQGLRVQSEPVTGTSSWMVEEVEVPVPAGCEAVLIQLRRKESLMFDSMISGDYWLDAVELKGP